MVGRAPPIGVLLAEDVRVTAHHLGMDRVHHVVNRELAALARDLGVKDDLKKQIAQLAAQLSGAAFACRLDGLEGFVGLFQKHRRERRVSLLAIPRAAIGRAQTRHQFDEISEGGGHSFKFGVQG